MTLRKKLQRQRSRQSHFSSPPLPLLRTQVYGAAPPQYGSPPPQYPPAQPAKPDLLKGAWLPMAEVFALPGAVTDSPTNGTRLWEYIGLDQQTHGPYSSGQMSDWRAKGFFANDAEVRGRGQALWFHWPLVTSATTVFSGENEDLQLPEPSAAHASGFRGLATCAAAAPSPALLRRQWRWQLWG